MTRSWYKSCANCRRFSKCVSASMTAFQWMCFCWTWALDPGQKTEMTCCNSLKSDVVVNLDNSLFIYVKILEKSGGSETYSLLLPCASFICTVAGPLCGFTQGTSTFFVLWQAEHNVFLPAEDGLRVLRLLLRQLIWERCTIFLWSSALEFLLQKIFPLENDT